MKKERSFYRAWIIFFCVLIALGVFLFAYSVLTGYGAGVMFLHSVTT